MALPVSPHFVTKLAAGALFAATYLGVAVGRLPGLGLDRAGIAFVGGVAMVGVGALSPAAALKAIDFGTVGLLLGMMLLAASLERAGFFHLAAGVVLRRVRRPWALLVSVVILSGVLSALLVNDTVCVVLAPLVLEIVLAMGARPLPYLIALAAAANIGGAATITGNPQNMIVGSIAGIGYGRFLAAEALPALVGLALTAGLVALVWRREFLGAARLAAPAAGAPASGAPPADAPAAGVLAGAVRPWAIARDIGLLGFFVAACLAGMAPAEAALIAGAACLLAAGRGADLAKRVDWGLLLMFAGLFVTVAGLEHTWLTPGVAARIAALSTTRTAVLAPLVLVLSNLVSNVPAILILRPVLGHAQHAWLVAAMAATYAGNLTLLGSVANLIVAERARARGVIISFRCHAMIGVPLTLATIGVGMAWLG